MAGSLTPVQTNHLQIRMLKYLQVLFHHSPRLLVVIVQTASPGRSRQPRCRGQNTPNGSAKFEQWSGRPLDHLTIPMPVLPLLPILADANPKPPSTSIPAFAPAPTTKPPDNVYSTPYVALGTTTGPPAHLSVKVNNAPSDPILNDAEVRSGTGTHTKAQPSIPSFARSARERGDGR